MENYKDLGLALLRSPALPGKLIYNLSNIEQNDEEFIAQAWRCTLLKEVILLTSGDLAEQINRFLASEMKDRKLAASLAEGVTRYLLRAALRPTPFGALSGLATVGVGAAPNGLHSVSALQLKAVADRTLVSTIVSQLEQHPDLKPKLTYSVNPNIIPRGSQLLIAAEYAGESATGPAAYRPASAARRWITHPSRPAKTYGALIQELQEQGSTEDAARRFIDDLIGQGFLLCLLRPPSVTPDPLAYLLEQLPEGLEADRQDLEQLQAMIMAFNSAPRANQLELYQNIVQRIRQWTTRTNTALQLTGCLSLSQGSEVPARWTAALIPVLEALLRLHAPAPVSPWPMYVEAFEERYGVREIPLLEMLDDERGLGAPPSEPRKHEDSPGWLTPVTDRWLLLQASTALRRGTVEIDLSLADLRQVAPQLSETFPSSVDAFVRPREQGQGAELLLSPVGFLVPSGRALGRFVHQFEELKPLLRKLAEVDEQRHTAAGQVVADLLHEFRNQELNAITAHPTIYTTSISTSKTSDAPCTHHLEDILVGVRDGAFTLRFQSTGQPFVTRSLHALVESEAPAAVRFLQRVGREHSGSAHRWHWGSAAQLPRTPRVRLGEVVLALARWQVPEHFCQGAPLGEAFDKWCDEWDVPEWVAVGEFDQKLSLCRTQPIHRRLLLRELTRGARHLEEVWEAPGEGLLQSEEGRRNVEVVLPLQHTSPSAVQPSLPRLGAGIAPPQEARLLHPGGPCLYLKIYGPRAEQDPVLRALTSTLPADVRWFFMRYQDPKHHVRLRVFGRPDELWTVWFPHLTKALEELSARDLVWSFQVDAYDREVERYGGWAGLMLAEQLFMDDSSQALHLRAQRRLDWPLSVTLCGTVDRFVRSFLPELTDRVALYDDIHARRNIDPQLTRRWSTDFGVQRQRLMEVFQVDEDANDSARRRGLAASYLQLEETEQLGRPLKLLLPSLVHMHCNRMGADQAQEWLTTFYLKKLMAGFRHHQPAGVKL